MLHLLNYPNSIQFQMLIAIKMHLLFQYIPRILSLYSKIVHVERPTLLNVSLWNNFKISDKLMVVVINGRLSVVTGSCLSERSHRLLLVLICNGNYWISVMSGIWEVTLGPLNNMMFGETNGKATPKNALKSNIF